MGEPERFFTRRIYGALRENANGRKMRRDPMRDIPLKKVRNRREFQEIDELEKLYSGFRERSEQLNFSEREMEKFKLSVPAG